MTYEEAKAGLAQIEERIMVQKIGNDMYYTSYQYDIDQQQLKFWQNKVKEFEQGVSKNEN